MKFADVAKYSPGTELFWNGSEQWREQYKGVTKRLVVPPGKLQRSGGKVLLSSYERVWNRTTSGYESVPKLRWHTLAGIRGPWCVCQSRRDERKRWAQQARVRQNEEYKRRGEIQNALERGFAEHGIVVRQSWDSLRISLLEMSEHDAILLLTLLHELDQ